MIGIAPAAGRRGPGRLGLLLVAAVTIGVGGVVPGVAAAAPAVATMPNAEPSRSGCQTVHAGPQVEPDAGQASYFMLTLSPGATQRRTVLVANPEPYPCSVTLEAASGETAVNSGDTYPVSATGCVDTACWLTGLPRTLTVPARGRLDVGFGVSVPADTTGGQYLAGVVIRPTDAPAVQPTGNDHEVAIAVSARVAIGVAVVVPGTLHPTLTIPSVTLDLGDATPTLLLHVHNAGNSWEHPTGGVRIEVGSDRRSFGVRASTILAGDTAILPVPAAGIPHGTWTTDVLLYFGNGQQAVWSGRLAYPEPRQAVAAPGTAPSSQRAAILRLPGWTLAVIGALAALVVLLAVVLLLLFRRRRRSHEADGTEGADDTGPTYRARHSHAGDGALADSLPR